MLYAFVKQILCFLFCTSAVITCHVQMLLVADISLALPSNQKTTMELCKEKKKRRKVTKSLFLYTVDLQNKIVALLSFSLSPQVTIITVTSFFIHLFDYLVADCQNHAHDTAHSAAKCLAGSILPASKVKTIVRKWVS